MKKPFILLTIIVICFLGWRIFSNRKEKPVEKDLTNSQPTENVSNEELQTETIFNYDSEHGNDQIKFGVGNVEFDLKRKKDSVKTDLLAKIGNKMIFSKNYNSAVNSVSKMNFKDNNIVIINFYSGGAHCCSVAVPYLITSDNVIAGKELYLGNIDMFKGEDFFVEDDKLMTVIPDDRFAYFKMDFASSGSMFFPAYYELSINPFGFFNRNDVFVDEYLKLYKELQQTAKEVINQQSCKGNGIEEDKIFGNLVSRYSLGFLANIGREELKSELADDWWCFSDENLDETENNIYKTLTDNLKIDNVSGAIY